ncbi:MAG TPA: tannase/feruloyl esterase family alpha/beta hydrolase [Vicinamibacterales bacterium]|nr:tannase/feruloyl esterase family alpha/beta hydrolase [Vicinamibacterales bacterium]
MTRIALGIVCVALLVPASGASAASCDDLSSLKLPDATITSAHTVAAGAFTQPGRGGATVAVPDLPAFCRVQATLRPSSDSDIHMEVWLPAAGWNGKFEEVGNGGWVGSVDTNAMAAALRRGYAAAGSDLGHQGGGGPWMANPEKLIDFGYRATHETAVKAKAIVAAFYGNAPRLSYFQGCSAGGRQALKEAQQFPADFDGIIAGSPALDTTGRAAFAIWVAQNTHKTEGSFIPREKFPVIHEAALAACDARDGVKDGVITDPRSCRFDPAVLTCKAGDAASCLTPAQVETAKTMYEPLRNPRTKAEIFPGFEPGSELGWTTMGSPQPFILGAQMFEFMLYKNPQWDYKTVDFDRDMAAVDKIEGGHINAKQTDLSAFIARGGKMIQYHGWADPQISPASSVEYYEAALKANKGRLQDDYRLFMVPGMNHCGGGDGPASFDMLTALEHWVEQKQAPASIPAAHLEGGKPDRTRILCPHPQVATYKGSGDPNDASNFVCK